jgi:hypothetical protein
LLLAALREELLFSTSTLKTQRYITDLWSLNIYIWCLFLLNRTTSPSSATDQMEPINNTKISMLSMI